MEMSEPVVISLKKWVDWALGDSLLESFRVVLTAGLMMCLFAT